MFKALLKTRMYALFSMMFQQSRNKKQHGVGFKLLIGIFAIYVVGVLGVTFGMLFSAICEPFSKAGLTWLYFSLAGLLSFIFCFFMTIFLTKSQLFEAQDNELLLSMPVPPSYILASRMMMLLVTNYIYELLIMIPAGVVYVMNQSVTVLGVIAFLFVMASMPLLAMAASCLFGWLVALISSRMRNKNLITLVFSVVFLCGYMYFYVQIQKYMEQLIQHGEKIGQVIKKSIFPLYHMGIAIAEPNIISLIIFLLCAIIPFGIVYGILTKNFIRIVTTHKGMIKIRYEEKPMKVNSSRSALIHKEFKRFFNCPSYMLNAGAGLIFMVIIGGMLIIKNDILIQMFELSPEMGEMMGALSSVGLSVCAAMTFISAPSISLEGKQLWIVKSLPIDPKELLLAKADAHILISLPFILLSGTLCNIAVKPTIIQGIIIYLLPLALTVLLAFMGVLVNLHFPKFDWISEAAAVKQGASPMICSLGSIGVIGVLIMSYFGLFIRFVSIGNYLIGCLLITGLTAAFFRHYLITNGKKVFEEL